MPNSNLTRFVILETDECRSHLRPSSIVSIAETNASAPTNDNNSSLFLRNGGKCE